MTCHLWGKSLFNHMLLSIISFGGTESFSSEWTPWSVSECENLDGIQLYILCTISIHMLREGLFRNEIGRIKRCLLKSSNWPEALLFGNLGVIYERGSWRAVHSWVRVHRRTVKLAHARLREEEKHRRWTEREQRLGVGQSWIGRRVWTEGTVGSVLQIITISSCTVG